MKKRILSLMMAGVMTASLTACGGGGSAETTGGNSTGNPAGSSGTETSAVPAATGPEGQSGAVTELSFWHHMEGINAVALEEVCTNFNNTTGAEYGIRVTPSFQGTNTAEKLNTLAQAGDWKNFPNLCQVASAGIPTISGYDLFVSVDAMYDKGEDVLLERDSIIANNARTFTYKDELCAMPFSNSTILLYYNKDMFTAAGLDAEQPPATLAEMAAAIEKLTVKSGNEVETYGLNVEVKRYQLVNWVGGQGEYNFIGDNEGGRAGLMTKMTMGEDGSLMSYLDEWEKIIQTGGYKPVEDNINEEFAMEINAMAIMSSARIAKVEGLVEDAFAWGTAPLPKVNAADQGGAAVGGSGVVMFDKGDEQAMKATWIFNQYLGGEDAQYTFCTASGYIPMNKDLYESDRMKAYLAENDKMVAAVEQLMASNPNVQEPFDIVTSEINSIIDEEMLAFARGERDKQNTHDNIISRCDAKLKEYADVNAE